VRALLLDGGAQEKPVLEVRGTRVRFWCLDRW
jgi:hypothetical protein